MLRRIAALFFVGVLSVQAVAAEDSDLSFTPFAEREYLGFGSLFVNDFLGDGYDRWRTGSYGTSRFWGYGWNGELPQSAGDLLELRVGGEIMAPACLGTHIPLDRPWAGVLTAGLHTQFQRHGTEFAFGGDVLMIGPQTGLNSLQKALHDVIGIEGPSDEVLAHQIPDQWRLRFVGETGRTFDLGGQTSMRPFVEARAGDENLVRAGVDFTIGRFGRGELVSRDWVTGHRYRAGARQEKGLSFVVGADIAKVFSSIYLPEDRGYRLTDTRRRVRAGLHWQGKNHHLFYGLTYLGEEFDMQYQGQLVGAVRLDIRF